MRLCVHVYEAQRLRAMDLNGSSDPYVRIKLGEKKFRTKVVKKTLNPIWGEEFSFPINDLDEELLVYVMDEDKYFNDDLVGQLKFPIEKIYDAPEKSLGTVWYTLQPKSKKSKHKDCGEILLSIFFTEFAPKNPFLDGAQPRIGNYSPPYMDRYTDQISESSSVSLNDLLGLSLTSSPRLSSSTEAEEATSIIEEKSYDIAPILNDGETAPPNDRGLAQSDSSETSEPETYHNKFYEKKNKNQSSTGNFDEMMKIFESKNQRVEVPSNLAGGVLVDQSYLVAPPDLNVLLFSPDSKFASSLADVKGNKELRQEPWKFENDGKSLKRMVTYLKAATKMMKAVKAIEEQTYLKANGNNFAVLVSVSTPDAKFGNTFKVETLYCITPGPELSSGEKSSRLAISWRINFLQSTMMKSMIEGGARKGLKESFEQYSSLLFQNVKPVDLKDLGSNKEYILASLQVEKQSDLALATQYLLNFTVVSAAFMGLYVLMHILLAMTSTFQGLEFRGLDLPDSFAETIVCMVLVLQGQRALPMISRFLRARVQKGTDHGVKAQGEGWLLTIALIEGYSLAAVDSTGFSDPYIIFTCNGKTKTSSIKFQKLDPQWNEVFEFDAMDEPPSVMDVEVFDFEGPFNEAKSLGHAEINFVKSNISDLADIWIPLQGKLAQACQSMLHLKIFMNNTKGNMAMKEYLTKVEKEVGKKINMPSPETNTAFQKLFELPPEEFLINDFTCRLKRKMLLQGRLFLSARIIGFHGNLFGNRTTFFFLWDDIEDIQVLSPTLTSMGSQSLIIVLWQGRGLDARHGAKKEDEEGRLKFHFHSFVSFGVAHRTIMALWKAKSLGPEQKVQIAEEESESKPIQTEETGNVVDQEDVSMSEVYSSTISVPMKFFMDLFGGGYLDSKVMEKVGYLDYTHTSWESVKPDVYQRQIYYKFDKHISHYRGEATSTQQISPFYEGKGWLIEEVLNIQGIPQSDHFTIHIRYQVEDLPKPNTCTIQMFFGIAWLKSTKNLKRLTKNIESNVVDRLKSMSSHVEQEFIQES
ncbi:hypothetical protein IFM89_028643 [Coptis chinensis]|uniref:C2 and GRAM domain-containing protein n=1 Tax=Coptis chinensis TaxID=261450 RepID=A0A835LFA5_9MAGN|nr:hypothetical protein IFM89_028643 [Coptis chinensis]